MKRQSRSAVSEPTMLIHHIREIQLRLLAVALVLIAGMAVGYIFHEFLFEFIKAPLNAPLHYMSPAGSFTFIIKICLMIGIVVALPIAIYNAIMFAQPALAKRLSRTRVHLTTFASLVLAAGGAAFGFLVIVPLALKFFYKFQVSGLEAIISADEYLRFVVGVVITFVIIFQLPLLVSLADHIRPLPPRKLLKFEKYVILVGVIVAIIVPFAVDPIVQLLIASPIVVLYNVAIIIVLIQHLFRSRRARKSQKKAATTAQPVPEPAFSPKPAHVAVPQPIAAPIKPRRVVRSLDGTMALKSSPPPAKQPPATVPQRPKRPGRLITDIRPASSQLRLSLPTRPSATLRQQPAE